MPLTNSAIAYTYDELRRLASRTVASPEAFAARTGDYGVKRSKEMIPTELRRWIGGRQRPGIRVRIAGTADVKMDERS